MIGSTLTTPLEWISASRTDQGRVRQLNEDSIFDNAMVGLWSVADGMGGHESGEVASQLITRTLQRVRTLPHLADAVDEVDDHLKAVNQALFERGAAQGRIMGSTVVVALARANLLALLWAGDSRAYLFRQQQCFPLTRDHTQLEALIDQGEVLPEEAEGHTAGRVVTRAVGAAAELVLDVEVIRAEPGDWIILCSDGVGKHITDNELVSFTVGEHPSDVVAQLISTVLERGAMDNVSAIALYAQIFTATTTAVSN